MYFRVADWLKAIVLVAILFAAYTFSGTISRTILLFILAALIVFVIAPIVNFLTSRGANRAIAIALTYTLFLSVVSILIFLIAPVISNQVSDFARDLPGYIDSLRRFANRIQEQFADIRLFEQIPFDPDVIITQATEIAAAQLRNLVLLIPSLFALITSIGLVLIISFYMLFYLPQIDDIIRRNLPNGVDGVYSRFLITMKTGLGRYILGQVSLMVAVGILSGLGVWLVGLPFPLLLGLWAGLTEIVPILGPILGAIPSVIIASTIEPVLALWVILIFIIIQQIESSALSPLIYRGTAGVNPLLTILAIIAGAEVAGIIGIFLAVPILVTIATIIIFIRDNFSYVRVKGEPDRVVIKE
ncbi:MAG: AI-2E family transporter [Actinobacteria bacterium]|nr:AI-2E family transporter [Actinomycetota bacterium]